MACVHTVSYTHLDVYKRQVWNLTEINGQLLMGHHEGAFIVKDYTANLLSSWTGFWTFKPISNFPPSQVIVGGNYRGISFFTYENQQFRNIDSNLLIESSRFLVIDLSLIHI